MTIGTALVSLAERGIRAELDAKKNLTVSFDRFLNEKEPAKKSQAGKGLIRAIFGNDAIAEDSVL